MVNSLVVTVNSLVVTVNSLVVTDNSLVVTDSKRPTAVRTRVTVRLVDPSTTVLTVKAVRPPGTLVSPAVSPSPSLASSSKSESSIVYFIQLTHICSRL